MQEKPFKRKPLTKADIERIRKTLPKRVEIKADGQTEVTEKEEPMEVAPILESQAPEISVPLSAEEIRSFQIYASMLREKNKVMNLTAVDDEQGIAMKHFIDSLTLCPYIRAEEEKASGKTIRLADVGTGAGFPGLPLKISMPELDVTLMDSLAKRLNFLGEVTERLGLEKVSLVHTRAEDGGRDKRYRERYDVVTARAVARLPVLAEYCLPFVKKGGHFIALKGMQYNDEAEEAVKAIKVMGGSRTEIRPVKLPEIDDKRAVIIINKTMPTPKTYPRKAGTPTKNPLV